MVARVALKEGNVVVVVVVVVAPAANPRGLYAATFSLDPYLTRLIYPSLYPPTYQPPLSPSPADMPTYRSSLF